MRKNKIPSFQVIFSCRTGLNSRAAGGAGTRMEDGKLNQTTGGCIDHVGSCATFFIHGGEWIDKEGLRID